MYLLLHSRQEDMESDSTGQPENQQIPVPTEQSFHTGPGPALKVDEAAINRNDDTQLPANPTYSSGATPLSDATGDIDPGLSAENVIGLAFIIILVLLGIVVWARFARQRLGKMKAWLRRRRFPGLAENSPKFGEETLINTPTPSDFSGTTAASRSPRSPNGYGGYAVGDPSRQLLEEHSPQFVLEMRERTLDDTENFASRESVRVPLVEVSHDTSGNLEESGRRAMDLRENDIADARNLS